MTKIPPLLRLGKTVKRIRTETGLGLREFAEGAGVSHCAVWRLERGMNISLSTWDKIARAYGIK